MMGAPGGSIANATGSMSNSLSSMFSPGADNVGPSIPIMDPFAGKLHSRFEVPDTMGTINMGDIVVFFMISDGESFYTSEILPPVEWNWAIKRINYGTWVFPQYAVQPTPETAPPRFVESYQFNDTTTLERFSIGQHMSVEYMKTARGQDNQRYNLKQIALTIQESTNLRIIRAILDCKRRVAERREIYGHYTPSDLEEEFRNEVSRAFRIQKEEHGFLTMWEEILREMKRVGGTADSVIITTRANTLVLARKEYTDYMKAGPAGPATVRDPNRSVLPANFKVYYSNTYPERYGSSTGPWQQLMQLGTYNQSRELSVIRSRSEDYFKSYDSKVRSVWIFDVDANKFIEVELGDMIKNCMIWDSNGHLKVPGTGRTFSGGAPIRDFLTMDERSMWSSEHWQKNDFEGHDLSESSFGGVGGVGYSKFAGSKSSGSTGSAMDRVNATRSKSRLVSALKRDDGVRAIGLIGHLDEAHFGVQDMQDSGSMILHRIADMTGRSAAELVSAIQEGLSLSGDMARRPIDYDWLDYVIRNAILAMYRSMSVLSDKSTNNAQVTTPHLNDCYIDQGAAGPKDVWKKIQEYCLRDAHNISDQQQQKLRILKNVFEHNLCLPLPVLSDANDKFNDRAFPNLTGYHSYAGFCEMGKLYKSGSQIPRLQTRYNMKELEVAAKFVDAIEIFAQGLETILPECALFASERDGSISQNNLRGSSSSNRARLIAEKVFNMGGLNIWVNLQKHHLFIIDNGTADKWNTSIAEPIIGDGTTGIANVNDFVSAGNAELGEWYQSINRNAMGSYFGDLLEKVPTVIDIFLKQYATGKQWAALASKFDIDAANITAIANAPENLLNMVLCWVQPIFYKPILNGPSSGLMLTAGTNGHHAIATAGTLAALHRGVGSTAYQLSAENHIMADNCILLSGPLRLAIYEAALKAVTLGHKHLGDKDPQKFLQLLLDINTIMAPSDKTRLPGLSAAVHGNQYPAHILPSYTANVNFLNKMITKWHLPATVNMVTGVGMTNFAAIIKEIYKEYFGDIPKLKNYLSQLNVSLDNAALEETKYETELTTISNGTALARNTIRFPILHNLRGKKEKDFTISSDFRGDAMSAENFLKSIVFPHLSNVLGVKLQRAEFGGDYDDVRIGAKSGKQKQKASKLLSMFDTQKAKEDENQAYGYSKEVSSFFKTSLVFSAEQIQELGMSNFGSNLPGANAHFDLRPTNPGDYAKYVSVGKIRTLVNLIEQFNSRDDIYSENFMQRPHWRAIPLLHADKKIKHTFFGAPMGTGFRYAGGCGLPVGDFLNKSFTNTAYQLDRSKCSAAVKMLTLLYMSSAFSLVTMLALVAGNVRVPMNIALARPHRNVVSESCAILSTGKEKLGCLVVACRDYVTGQSVLTKEWNGHASYWCAPMIYHPENVYVQHNVMMVGYGTGHGVRFYNRKDNYGPGQFCGKHTPNANWPSLFCFAVPFTEIIDREYINTPGKIPHLADSTQSTQIRASEDMRREQHYSTCERYNEIWNFNTTTDSGLMRIMGSNGTLPAYNTQCYQDTAFYWDPYKKKVAYVALGTGHLGKNVGPGFKEIMQGKVVSIKDFEYEKQYMVV